MCVCILTPEIRNLTNSVLFSVHLSYIFHASYVHVHTYSISTKPQHLIEQIKSESFLEDINNILNSGDVPNIYPPEDLDKIFNEMKPVVQDAGLQPTKSNLFSAYTKRVRSNIHMVICMR